MAKLVSKKFSFRPVGTFGSQAKHNWDEILDGSCRIYIQGDDFPGKAQNWAYQAKMQGCKRGLEVQAQVLTEEQCKAERLPDGAVAVAVQANLDTTPERAEELRDRYRKYQVNLKTSIQRRKAGANGHTDSDEAEETEE